MSETEIAVSDEREACARECDEVAKRFRMAADVRSATFETLIAREKAGVAEALGRIIRARWEG
jgi:hypothetical protein